MFLSAGERQLGFEEGSECQRLFWKHRTSPGERMAVAGVGLLAVLRVSDHIAGSIKPRSYAYPAKVYRYLPEVA
jgi:hypothetical protein